MRSRRHFLLFATVLCGLVLSVYAFWLLPMRDELVATEERLITRQRELTAIRAYMHVHPDRAAYEMNLKRQHVLVQRLLPDALDSQRFLEDVEDKAKANNVRIHRVLPEKSEIYAEVQTQYITIEFTSDYFALLSFLAALEQDRFCRIYQAETKAEEGMLRTKMRIGIYALP